MCSNDSIYYLRVGVTGCEVSFKQGEFRLTVIHLCSVFTAGENVGYLIPHQKVVSVSESLPMLIAEFCYSTCTLIDLSIKGAI